MIRNYKFVILPSMEDFIIHPNMPGYVSVKEAAEMLHLSQNRVRAIIADGRLPAVWAGKNTLMMKEEDVKNFKRMGSGRKRKKVPTWRLSEGMNTQHMTSITVRVIPGQEETLKKTLEQIKRNEKHLFPGTIARYFSQSNQNSGRIKILLIWRGSLLPDETKREQELAAFRQSFLGILDWSAAHYENYHVLMHT